MASNEREDMKTCSKCKVEKETVEFSKDKSRNDGLSRICKGCDSKKKKKWSMKEGSREKSRASARCRYWMNPEKCREKKRVYRKENRGLFNAINKKNKARKKGLTPEMNKAELVEIESMYMYNQIMPGDWHVDHIKPLAAGGLHHPSNLQVLSKFDNLTKGAKWDM